jgi:hypothetical protein
MKTQFPLTQRSKKLAALSLAIPVLLLLASPQARAADHRDSPTADGAPQADITDFFAFLDPNAASNLVLIMNVNPFSYPNYHRALAWLGQLRAAQGRYAEAADLYRCAIAIIPLPVYAAARKGPVLKMARRSRRPAPSRMRWHRGLKGRCSCFHAGMIFDKLGDTPRALELNPGFHIEYADVARLKLKKQEVASVR